MATRHSKNTTEQQIQKNTVTGFRRKKTASRAVLIADNIADRVISVGGILVIIAVLGIMVFLIQQTLPLFRSGNITAEYSYPIEIPEKKVLNISMDEQKTMGLLLFEDGSTQVFHARTGTLLTAPRLHLEGKTVTSFDSTIDQQHFAFGFADGTIRMGQAQFMQEIIPADSLSQHFEQLDTRDSTDGTAVYSKIPGSQIRKTTLSIELDEPIQAIDTPNPIVALDYHVSGQAERQLKTFAVIDSKGTLMLNLAESKLNLMTGKQRTKVKKIQLPPLPEKKHLDVHSLLLTEKADMLLVADSSGTAYRYNIRNPQQPMLAEAAYLLREDVRLTVCQFLLGGQTIVVTGTDGSLNMFFVVNSPEGGTQDGQAFMKGRIFASSETPVVQVNAGTRGKGFAVAYQNGEVKVLHATSQKTLAKFSGGDGMSYHGIVLSPRMDGLMTLQENGLVNFWEFSVPHPETTVASLFGKVWYEGYQEPTYTWQSSAATDEFEPKLSLIPLIFGTIKAAMYSLLFAIPIALLGAIYTSEFVHPTVRGVVKPTMEMMASLPSVVLGFVAALVLAPIVETWIAAVLLAFIAIPVGLMLNAFLWQLLPLYLANRWHGVPKFSLMMLVVVFSMYATYTLGPLFESLFFHGDFKAWVNGDVGGAAPFLFLILLPVSFTLTATLVSRFFGHRISEYMSGVTPFQAALFDIVKWAAMTFFTIIVSYFLAKLLGIADLDARGGFVGTYVQRNTLIVGFAMGFAVIPIIYTIAEDALNAVPAHLRAASLGCGATTWQTAIYVVLPTAMSGVFSAIMVGMGRAVGETMIVVMAAGNTPLMDWNVFNGLRALSATIAVELPEAVKGGTLYRILFLSGLVLFAMTFVINTIAEVVRIRFRKRAAQL